MALSKTKKWVSAHLPSTVRERLWYLTDSTYRSRYKTEMSRIRGFHAAHDAAWPLIWKQTGGRIASGPFAGMMYLEQRGKFNQKLVGTYEMEIVDCVETICRSGYRKIVVIGAADGYYACGFALRNPNTAIVAFEQASTCREELAALAALNQCAGRIQVRGTCTLSALRDELADDGRCLVVCDIDGGEVDLLDMNTIDGLRRCDLLVEVHDRIAPGTTDALTRRFSPSHEVRFIAQQPRSMHDLPTGIQLDSHLALAAMDEFRGSGNDWLWMKAR